LRLLPYACFASNAGVASRSGSADIADTAAAFTGPLAGDVTGMQSATVVTYVGGQNAVDLDAAALTSGSVDDARLSANVARLDADQVFIGSNRFSGVVQLAHPANTLTGMFSGIGSELTALNPAHLTTGTAAIDISGNAATATTASRAESVTDNAVTAAGIAPGQVVKSLNGLRDSVTLAEGANLTLTSSGQTLTLATPADWHLTGNSGTMAGTHFLGTADNQPLELKVHSSRALRLEPNAAQAPNVIAGARHNAVGAGGGRGNHRWRWGSQLRRWPVVHQPDLRQLWGDRRRLTTLGCAGCELVGHRRRLPQRNRLQCQFVGHRRRTLP
jgi:hypothetical protein